MLRKFMISRNNAVSMRTTRIFFIDLREFASLPGSVLIFGFVTGVVLQPFEINNIREANTFFKPL